MSHEKFYRLVTVSSTKPVWTNPSLYYKDQKFHTKSMEEKLKKINFQWHYSIKSSLRQVINHLSLVHVYSCRQQ